MGIQNPILRKIPGIVFILLAVISQLYLARRLRLSRAAMWSIALSYTLVCVGIGFEVIPNPGRKLSYFFDVTGSFLTAYGWLCDFAAIVFLLRFKLPRKFSEDRRQFLNTTASVICAVPAVSFAAGCITRKDFQVKEFDLKIPGLPKDLQGLRLLQLSDIHMGVFFSPNDLRRVVDASNGLRADLAFVTGDLITNTTDPIDECLMELKRLKTSSGAWGCMGNHEKLANIAGYVAKQAKKQDLIFLRRESESLKFGNSRINLVGVDHQFKGDGYLIGMEQYVKQDEFNLLLSHNPDVFPVAAKQGFQLTLSGHTHGGQINLEVANTNLNIVDLVTPYTKGLYQKPESSLYVTSGLGTIGVPVRLGSPPEITLIRLCAS